MSPADVSCIKAIANGDRSALADLYDRYASTMLAVGIRILRDRLLLRWTRDLAAATTKRDGVWVLPGHG